VFIHMCICVHMLYTVQVKLVCVCVCVCVGKAGDYAEYYEVILRSKLIFGWWLPDDVLVL